MDIQKLWEELYNSFTADAFFITGAIVVGILVFYVLKQKAWKKIKESGDHFIVLLYHRFNRPLQLIIALTATVLLLNYFVEDLDDQLWYQKTYSICVVLIITWMAVRAIGLFSDLFLRKFDVGTRDNLKARRIHTQIGVLRRLAIAITTLIGISCALMVFEQIRALGVSLIASAGVAGIIIGFAAQKTIGNFFTGFQIALTQPIRIGDVVIVENEWGVIEEINLTYVVVKIWDLRRLVLPITYFVDHPFQNWTRTSADLLATVILHMDYAAPLEEIRAEFDRLMETEHAKELWNGQVKVVQVIDATEKTMQVRFLLSADDASIAFSLRCHVREQMISFIQKQYPESLPRFRTDMHMTNAEAKDQAGSLSA